MHVITTETQKKIIDAFFMVASNYPNKKITVEMIGQQAGMSRENIYHNHFRGIKEIIEKIHLLVDEELYNKFQRFVYDENTNLLNFLTHHVLPFLYEKREWLKILYGTQIDPEWEYFLESRYAPLINNYLDKIGKKDIIPNHFLSQIFVKEFMAIISVWLTDNNPEPPSLFIKKFIYILSQSPTDMIINASSFRSS